MAKNSPGSLFQPTLQSEKKPEGQKKSFLFSGPFKDNNYCQKDSKCEFKTPESSQVKDYCFRMFEKLK